MISMIHRSDLRIRSKADALEFYEGIKACVLIPHSEWLYIRVEPNKCISTVSRKIVAEGKAWMIPSQHDADGSIAYGYRKHINAYLARE